jgi:hypothetical protein
MKDCVMSVRPNRVAVTAALASFLAAPGGPQLLQRKDLSYKIAKAQA